MRSRAEPCVTGLKVSRGQSAPADKQRGRFKMGH